jgi:hypothetical protein
MIDGKNYIKETKNPKILENCVDDFYKRESQNFSFCQVMSFAILWAHNSYIQGLIEELSKAKL